MVDSSHHWSRQCSKGTDSLKTTKLKPQETLIIIIIYMHTMINIIYHQWRSQPIVIGWAPLYIEFVYESQDAYGRQA